MRLVHAVAGLVLIALPRAAAADDWRYCLAAAPAAHKLYLSGLFQTSAAMETLESAFGRSLGQQGFEFETVQCPRGETQISLSAMQQSAIGFNREMGNRAVRLDWKPPR